MSISFSLTETQKALDISLSTDLTAVLHTSVGNYIADPVSPAVVIVRTLHLITAPGEGGISNMSVQTSTLRLLVDQLTLSVGSTGVRLALNS